MSILSRDNKVNVLDFLSDKGFNAYETALIILVADKQWEDFQANLKGYLSWRADNAYLIGMRSVALTDFQEMKLKMGKEQTYVLDRLFTYLNYLPNTPEERESKLLKEIEQYVAKLV